MLFALVLLFALGSLGQSYTCRFATQYKDQDILLSAAVRNKFLQNIFAFEKNFHAPNVSYNEYTGMTFDGRPLNYTTGNPALDPHPFSAPSKESLHISMLALSLDGNALARTWIGGPNNNDPDETAYNILLAKINTLETWNEQYPGYGGFLPWFFNRDWGITPVTGWENSVPGLDNGQMLWSMVALCNVLQNRTDEQWVTLYKRYQNYLNMLTNNVVTVFYAGSGHINAVTRIANISLPPNQNVYTTDGGGCNTSLPDCNPYLDDPYEGELLAWFMDLFGAYPTDDDRTQVWINKRRKLQNVTFGCSLGPITVQRGWWFSAHEQWKTLFLPYLQVNITSRVFKNGERARACNSVDRKIPGLYASVNDVSRGENIPDYISAAGVIGITFQPVVRTDIVTPYATFPMMLISQPQALVWYRRMLLGPKMQSIVGSTEAVNINGTEISPLTTWDSKVTTVVSMLGGINSITSRVLQAEPILWERFQDIVFTEYSLKFPTLTGENVPILTPTEFIPVNDMIYDFTGCAS